METTLRIRHQQTAEPFWQRIQKFFLLPLDRAVLLRICGLSGAGGLAVLLLLRRLRRRSAGGLRVLLVAGARYGFKIIERSSKGYLIPSDYPLTDGRCRAVPAIQVRRDERGVRAACGVLSGAGRARSSGISIWAFSSWS